MHLTYIFLSPKNIFTLKLGTYFFTLALIFSTFNSFAQVGINTTDPKTTLDVNGALSLRESPTPLRVVSGNNNTGLELSGETKYSQYNIAAGPGPILTAFSIDGIKSTPIADGQILRLVNTTSQVMTIVHNPAGDESKIVCPSDHNLIVGSKNSSVTLQYSKRLEKWTVFGYATKLTNKYSVIGAATEDSKTDGTWEKLKDMEITFTPVNSVVYVSYSAYGDVRNSAGIFRTEGSFRLVKNGEVVKNTEIRTGALTNESPYQAIVSLFPLTVTPGIPTTLILQWAKQRNGTIYNNPYYDSHARYITIID